MKNPLNYNAVPSALKTLNQWVCWRYEQRHGKQTKIPIQVATGGYAKTNEATTWSSFDAARAACGQDDLDGIGLCIGPQDGLTCIDLDHVLRPEEPLTPEAEAIVQRFKGTYIELSPSGEGLHIWCYGKAKRSGKGEKGNKWVEVYTHPSSRYLTITGKPWLGSNNDVTPQQEALDWLHETYIERNKLRSSARAPNPPSGTTPHAMDDDELLERARHAKNGEGFSRLWGGDTSAHDGDASAADLALCNHLAFWTNGDSTQMDRLFRRSGLMRDKWDETHYSDGRTYGQGTIDKALADRIEGYDARGCQEDEADTKRKISQWLSGFVYVTTRDEFVNAATGSAHPPRAFRNMAERAFPKRWGKRSPATRFHQEGHTHVRDVFYWPGQPTIVEKDTTADGPPEHWLNTYRKPKLPEPKQNEELEELFLNHVRYISGDDEQFMEQFLNWMATLIQKPGQRVHWLPLLISPAKGTGKGILGKILTTLLGKWNIGKLDNQAIGGSFHDAFIGRQLLIIEEFHMFDDRNARLNEFKTWITEDLVPCNRKGRGQISVDNVVNFIASSNYEAAASIDRDERRYLVAINYKPAKPPEYYLAMAQAFLPGDGVEGTEGIAALLYLLKQRDLSNFDPYAPATKTGGCEAMLHASLSPLQQQLTDLLERQEGALAREIIEFEDLRRAVVAANCGTGPHGGRWEVTNRVIGAAARMVGMIPLGQKRVLDGDRKTNVYCLRNPTRWEGASEGEIKRYLDETREFWKAKKIEPYRISC